MKRTYTRLLAMVTALVLALGLSGGALAAEAAPAPTATPAAVPAAAKPITVQLDGKDLTFSDAAPEAISGRTFLPLRTVFESLGATVDYNADTKVITAVRGDTTVAMTLGGTDATVTVDGVSTTLTMDVAPYAKANRTYVPVRFAAQAMGCAVGWDSDDSTVVLINTDKLLKDALSKYTFKNMDQFSAYNARFNKGSWAMDASFDASVSMMDLAPMLMTGSMKGLVSDGAKMETTMRFKLDIKDFLMAMVSATGESPALTAEEQAIFTALKTEGIGVELRMDMDAGMMYMLFSGDLMAQTGLPANTWISMDMNALFAGSGMDYTALMDLSKTMDASALISTALATLSLDDKDTDYESVSGVVDAISKFLADESFVKEGNKRTTSITYQQGTETFTLGLTLLTNSDAVVGYSVDLAATAATTDAAGKPADMRMLFHAGIDANDHMTGTMSMHMPDLMDMELNLTGNYTASTKAPQTQPPAGAAVISYEQLMGIAA